MIYSDEANKKSRENRLELIKTIYIDERTLFLDYIEQKILECVKLGINNFYVNVMELHSVYNTEEQCRQIVIHYLQDLGYHCQYNKYDRFTLLIAW